MRPATRFSSLALGLTLVASTLAAAAQQKAPVTIKDDGSSGAHNWTTEQILTCTVSDCWQLAGKNESTFFDIVQQLAVISSQQRGLALPESAEAGQRAGEYIKAKAKADHGALLYAIVDASVRKVGVKPTASSTK
jgi:hypothetical protein